MSKDPRLADSLKRLGGVVDRRGVWAGLEARAAAERSRAEQVRRRGPRLAVAGLATLVLLAGMGVGVYEGVHHSGRGQSSIVFTDSTGVGTTPSVATPVSGDDGWIRLPLEYDGASVNCLVMDPSDSSVLYAGTASGVLFKSTDGAGSWKQILDIRGSIDSLGIDPNAPRTLYVLATTRGGFVHVLMRTVDGGATWSDLSGAIGLGQEDTDGFSSEEPVFDASRTPSGVYISADGWWKSKDGGDHWSKASEEDTADVHAKQGTPVIVRPPRWIVDEATGQKALSTSLAALIDPRDAAICYAATLLGVYKSTDGGTTWDSASKGMVSSEVASLVVDPADSAKLYAATPMGIFRSSDRGASWKRILSGGADADDTGGWWSSGSVVVAPSGPGTLYARTSFGLFRSDNGGDDWAERAGAGLPTKDAPVGVNDPVVLVAPDSPDVVFVQASDGIYRSADGGETFSRVIVPAAELLADPKNQARIYAVWETGEVLASTDDGASWITSDITVASSYQGFLVAFAADMTGRFFFIISEEGEGQTMVRGGLPQSGWLSGSWSAATGQVSELLCDLGSPGTIYAGTVEPGGATGLIGIMMSADAGATWQDITGDSMADLGGARLAVDSQGALYVATNRGLFRREPGP